MGKMEITTNNVPRNVIYGYDLTDKEKKDHDYLFFTESNETHPNNGFYRQFVRYQGTTYLLSDFDQTQSLVDLNSWDGYMSDTFWSGIIFRYVPDTDYEQVVMGRYYYS